MNTDSYAFIDSRGYKMTYLDLDLQIERYGSVVERKALVMVVADQSIDAAVFYVAMLKNHIPVLLTDIALGSENWMNLIRQYQPEYIWFRQQEKLKNYSCIWNEGKCFLYRCDTAIGYSINEDMAVLLSTSGSTGSAKCVRLSHENIAANAKAIIKSLEISSQDVAAMSVPFCYAYGLSVLHTNLLQRATILFSEYGIYDRRFWDFAEENGMNSFCGVPYTYELLKKLGVMNRQNLKLRLMTQAGGAMSLETQHYFLQKAQERAFDFAVMYGQTEATARMSCFLLNHQPEKLGSVGRAISGGAFSVVCSKEYEQSDLGDIIYQGNNVFMGYASSWRDLQRGDEQNRILYTGDMGYLDRDGYLYVSGRKKRIAKIQGKRISLDELQNRLKEICCEDIVCLEGKEKLLVITSAVGQKEKWMQAVKQLKMDSRIVEVLEGVEIPRTANGKIAYGKLERQIAGIENIEKVLF